MNKTIRFEKIEEISQSLITKRINFSNQIFIIKKKFFLEMSKVSRSFLKFIEKEYKMNNFYNSDIKFIKDFKSIPNPDLSFSPMRLDFLVDNKDQLILSDINLPGSLVPDLFWPSYGLKFEQNKLNIEERNYIAFNAYTTYNRIILENLKENQLILRFLEINTKKPEDQQNFLKILYNLITKLDYINIKFINKEINQSMQDGITQNFIASVFLNTHNSPDNIINSIKTLIKLNKPIFVNPKLLPFTDKCPPSLDYLQTVLKNNEAEYLSSHLPKTKDLKDFIIKRRFGHSASSYGAKNGSQIKFHPYPEIKLERLNTFNYHGLENNSSNFRDFLFELSLNTFIVTKHNRIKQSLNGVSVSSRGSKNHPISGPHTLLFPTIVEV